MPNPLSVLRKLHNLETMAVQIYQVQIPRLSDPAERELMTAARDNEMLHRDTFAGFLRLRKAGPSPLRPFWSMVGQVLGRSTALLGRNTLLRGDAAFEEKAVREYTAFVAEKVLEGEEALALARFLDDEKKTRRQLETPPGPGLTLRQRLGIDMDAQRKEKTLLAALSRRGKVAVAFSGGTDSTYLLAAALAALGRGRVLALVADTPLLKRGEAPGEGEAEMAAALARSLGAEARVEALDPLLLPEVAENGRDRCYHCKRALFTRFLEVAGGADLLEGSHADDLAAHRPGKRALEELGVASPLAEAGLGKEEIRFLSRLRGLPTADRPSSPCLATRFPYGADITVEALRRVEAGERALAEEGLSPHRLRDHGETARLELPPALFPRLLSDEVRERVTERLRALGWHSVVLDLRGLRSGSFDE